jgi:hypothetical protein
MSEVRILTEQDTQWFWEKRGWCFINPPFPSLHKLMTLEEALNTISPREADPDEKKLI